PVRFLPAALLALAATLLLPSFSRAEEKKGAWEAGLSFGSSFFSNELRLENAGETGVRFGWYWKPSYEWEFQYRQTAGALVQNDNTTLIKDITVFFGHPGLKFSTDSYAVRFLINPRNVKRRLKPYAVFGYSLVHYNPSPSLQGGEKGDTRDRPIIIGGG